MTNTHNRTNSHQAADTSVRQSSSATATVSASTGNNTSGRFFANNSSSKYAAKASTTPGGSAKKQQQQLNASLNSSQQSSGSRGGNYYYNQQQQQQFKGSPSGAKYFGSENNEKFFVPLKAGISATSTPGKLRSSPQHRGSPTGGHGAVLAQLSSSPPNLSHFAGSKCYDAPAPTALPKPPRHWTGSSASGVTLSTIVPPVSVAAAVPKPKSQAYYQKSGGSGKGATGKMSGAKKHVNQHHRQGLVHHNPMMSCSREYLMAAAATNVAGGHAAGGNSNNIHNVSNRNDYDKFSENLKMVLNVRA